MLHIDIDKESIPYFFDIALNNETYTFSIGYNSLKDFFYIDLYKNNEAIVYGEKIIYGKPLFLNSSYRDVPDVDIIPYDFTGSSNQVTWDSLSETVFLYIVGDEYEVLE